jgi:sugar phosphate isomerase/epimerase
LKISLSNGVFSQRSLDENIASVKRLGFENIEFNMKCIEEGDEEAVFAAKKLIDSHGLNCLSLHAASLHVREESEIAKAIYYGKVSSDFAYRLSAPLMVVHSNVHRRLPEKFRNKFLERIFRKLIPYAKNFGLKLALENLSYASTGFGKNVSEIEDILRIVDDGTTGITLDFCHAEATGQTWKLLETYKNIICNVHISNRAHKPFEAETPSLKALLIKLQKYRYSGPLTMELNRKSTTKEIRSTRDILEEILSKNGAGCGI